ncbi:MAG: S1C family serine protease [Gammaproteobacteria bacterium]
MENNLRPDPDSVNFDLDRALSAVVALKTHIPEDALTASVLGTEREGHGVVINDQGLILTIGYLVTEAASVWVIDAQGRGVPGHVAAYDQESGFGLVQALQRLDLPALELGSVGALEVRDPVVVAGHGGIEHALNAVVIGKREFAGYWEYVLDEALFTAPAHPNWGGAAVIAADGRLAGIGSLLVQHVTHTGETASANMVVPVDELKPILNDLLAYGRRNSPGRPWLGWLLQEDAEHLAVAGVYDDCPADQAGIVPGDLVLEVDGEAPLDLADAFRRIWRLGAAGVEVPITIERDGDVHTAVVQSIDRSARLKTAALH